MGDSRSEVRLSTALLDGAAEQADKLCGRSAAEAETAVLEAKGFQMFPASRDREKLSQEVTGDVRPVRL